LEQENHQNKKKKKTAEQTTVSVHAGMFDFFLQN
jgi:hypothetical protein